MTSEEAATFEGGRPTLSGRLRMDCRVDSAGWGTAGDGGCTVSAVRVLGWECCGKTQVEVTCPGGRNGSRMHVPVGFLAEG